ncbi:CPBP family intramembrane glutamic endopeptidase [Streptococcus himalayensis]|uniref:Peptidase n=1 Tax=Streptococcus himalayensis TaxID=1888195 RepID=A0A917EE62_9STRE|nr:type II CAAX endopeptidase family protein [Streptococcus himalayensis]GGE24563.1 peptidase [Streptococcus himalayensis]
MVLELVNKTVEYMKKIIVVLLGLMVILVPERLALFLAIWMKTGLDSVSLLVSVQLIFLSVVSYRLLDEDTQSLIWKKGRWRRKDLLVFIVALLMMYVMIWFRNRFFPIPYIQGMNATLYRKISSYGVEWLYTLGNGFILVVVTPILEEFFHRGYVMNQFFKHSPYYLDVIFSAALFGVGHIILGTPHFNTFLFYSLFGLIMGGFYRFSNSLKWTICLHACWNLGIFLTPVWIFIYNWFYFTFR